MHPSLPPKNGFTVFCCFQVVEKGWIGEEWVKLTQGPYQVTKSPHFDQAVFVVLHNSWKQIFYQNLEEKSPSL